MQKARDQTIWLRTRVSLPLQKQNHFRRSCSEDNGTETGRPANVNSSGNRLGFWGRSEDKWTRKWTARLHPNEGGTISGKLIPGRSRSRKEIPRKVFPPCIGSAEQLDQSAARTKSCRATGLISKRTWQDDLRMMNRCDLQRKHILIPHSSIQRLFCPVVVRKTKHKLSGNGNAEPTPQPRASNFVFAVRVCFLVSQWKLLPELNWNEHQQLGAIILKAADYVSPKTYPWVAMATWFLRTLFSLSSHQKVSKLLPWLAFQL